MRYLILASMLFLSGCEMMSFMHCGDAGVRSCDGFMCMHDICNGQPLTEAEKKAGIK